MRLSRARPSVLVVALLTTLYYSDTALPAAHAVRARPALVSPRNASARAEDAASAEAQDPLREHAKQLHREAIVLDTHADMSPFLQSDTVPPLITDPGMAGPGYDPSADPLHAPIHEPWRESLPTGPWHFDQRHKDGYMDLPRIREGGLDAEFVSIFMDREPRPGMSVKRSLDQIDGIRAACAKYADQMALATTADDVRRIVASGRFAVLMGMEGGHMIEDDLRVLRMYYLLGVRYMTLTHCFNTDWADSSGCSDSDGIPAGHGLTEVKPEHGGLSPFGREVVKEMNRLGMIVDVSHVADSTFYDVIKTTRAPVIASHSSVDGIKEHARNMSDDMLRALAKNDGVIQIDQVERYIDPVKGRERAPLSVFIDHIVYAVKVAGPDHVGIGLDYGYDAPTPIGLEDVSKFEEITYELLKRGFDDTTIKKIWGENTLRVMAEVERVAATSAAALAVLPR